MDRRKFITNSALVGVAGSAALATPSLSQGKEKLTMVTTWGRGSFGVHDAAQRFADNCNAISGGTLEIDLKANGELVSGTAAAFDAMTSDRPYRKGLSYKIAFSELEEFSGSQFDPKLSEAYIKAMKKDQEKNENLFKLTLFKNGFQKKAA